MQGCGVNCQNSIIIQQNREEGREREGYYLRGVWRVREGGRSAESYYQPPSPGIFKI